MKGAQKDDSCRDRFKCMSVCPVKDFPGGANGKETCLTMQET